MPDEFEMSRKKVSRKTDAGKAAWKDAAVTVGSFVQKLWQRYSGELCELQEIFTCGKKKGWLEEQDEISASGPLKRKDCARIVHLFLKRQLEEADEDDFGAASNLQDLYDCRVCVNHVAQVYVKGIMDAKNQTVGVAETENESAGAKVAGTVETDSESAGAKVAGIRFEGDICFGMNKSVGCNECDIILDRTFDTALRRPRFRKAVSDRRAEKITPVQYRDMAPITSSSVLPSAGRALLVDVRTPEQYEDNHLAGAVNIPFAKVLKNPYIVGVLPSNPVVFYCNEGYQSEIAANCLVKAGYEKVFYLGLHSMEKES